MNGTIYLHIVIDIEINLNGYDNIVETTQTWEIGDCRDLMKKYPDKYFNLIVTDPPYGVGIDYGVYEDTADNWYELMDSFIPEARRVANMVVMPSCQIKRLGWIYENHEPDWLIAWYKGSPGTVGYLGFNDWEPLLVYGKNKGVSMHDYFYCRPEAFNCGHPCPKPLCWSTWIIERCTKEGDLVCDPFLGSGRTLLACRNTNRNCVGFEINPEYESVIIDQSMAHTPKLSSFF